jgi:FAD/FMN-containing dehydrogenase
MCGSYDRVANSPWRKHQLRKHRRPHWGKHFLLRRSEVEAMYPDSYDKFRNIRKELDPKGVFTNTLIHQLFD